ncbi:NACHT domain-containing protein [Actinoplanes sp. NPDC049265]|uniref:NACHT domain-containing protein n=1 Tax=Actinoplanes sp. NPDC049265 TaxID=3363902 RepID=UPI00372346F4
MDPITLAGSAVKAAAQGIPLISKKLISKRRNRAIADEAASLLSNDAVDRLVDQLTERQRSSVAGFIDSAQFGAIVQQATILTLTDMREEETAAIREQIRHGLRLRGGFDGADQLDMTDKLENLVYESVHAVRRVATPTAFDSARALAIASRVAIAGARNSELLAGISTLTEIDKFAQNARSAVRSGNSKLRMASHNGGRQVEYAELYVTPALVPRADQNWWYPLEEETASASEVAAYATRFVILGDPGAGKSTMAAKLAHDIAADLVPGLCGQVPFLLRVRDHTASLRTDHETLLHYLEATCRRPRNICPPPDAVEYLLLNGRAVVIVDGVDELGTSEHRRSFAELLEGFAHRFPLARIVVTSRVVGYDEAPLDADLFPASYVRPFSLPQVQDYAKRWFRLSTTRPEDRDDLTTAFLHESNIASDLRENPLLLSLLCGLYSSVHYIPRNRPEIFEKCAELLFETWDRQRGIEVAHRYGANIRPAVQHLAWKIFTDPVGRQALPRPELVSYLANFMQRRRFENRDEAEQAASDFLDYCAGRAWVLTELGTNSLLPVYGFVHRTFLEYFAATQLVKQNPRPGAVWKAISAHVDDFSWEVMAQLAVQILDRTVEGGAEDLLQLATSRERSYDAKRFAARALDTVAPANDSLRAVIESIVTTACEVSVNDRRVAEYRPSNVVLKDMAMIEILRVTSPDNVERVIEYVTRHLIKNAQERPVHSSAGLLVAAIQRGLVNQPIAARVAQVLQLVKIPSVEYWQRILSMPGPDDITADGLDPLYKSTLVLGGSYPPPVINFLEHMTRHLPFAGNDQIQAFKESLEEYYPAIISYRDYLSRQVVSVTPGYLTVLGHLARPQDVAEDSMIMLLSAEARAAFILLLMPFAEDPSDHFGSLIAKVSGSRRSQAESLISYWRLPADAHHYLMRWVSLSPHFDAPVPSR